MNNKSQYISNLIYRCQHNQESIEIIRDTIHALLHQENPTWFPYGPIGTAVVCVAIALFNNSISRDLSHLATFPVVHEHISLHPFHSISQFINDSFLNYISHHHLSQHHSLITNPAMFPSILVVSLSEIYINIDKEFIINSLQVYKLIGIVYHGNYHFTSRLILPNNIVWIHDGMINNGNPIYENNLNELPDVTLWTCNHKQAAVAVYKKVL